MSMSPFGKPGTGRPISSVWPSPLIVGAGPFDVDPVESAANDRGVTRCRQET